MRKTVAEYENGQCGGGGNEKGRTRNNNLPFIVLISSRD
jgi:hypothetical protein